ncbi:hypothetical protein ACTGZQ_01375 [Streptococcus suis]
MTESRQLAEIAKIAGSMINEQSIRITKMNSEYLNSVFANMKPVIKQIETTMRIISSSLTNVLKNIDFEGFIKQLEENEKRKLAYCLEYDVYIPPLSL